MNLSREEAVIYAALIAAVVSLASAFISYVSSRSHEVTKASRSLLEKNFNLLGSLIYELMAYSTGMVKAKSDEQFDEKRKVASETIVAVDKLRRNARYSLWGLDKGLRTIQWMPNYIAHNKNGRNSDRVKKILKLGNELRDSIDKALMQAYFTNGRPRWRDKIRVDYKAWKLRRYFDNSKPSDNESQQD